jgi:ABC-type glycerol-3-phosphate transport system substrate-binding protein
MKRPALKKKAAAIALVLAVSMGSSMCVSAATETKPSTSSSTPEPKESLATKRKALTERQQKVAQEALEAITGTQHALIALDKNESQKAMALLQDVSGKLDILLAKYPGLNLIPAHVDADVYDFEGDSKQVEKLVEEADDLLDDNKVQDARAILAELVCFHIWTPRLLQGKFSKLMPSTEIKIAVIYSVSL